MKAALLTEPSEQLNQKDTRTPKPEQEYIEAWMRDDDINRREQLHQIEYDC